MTLALFKLTQLAVLAVFVRHAFDLRRKRGMVPLVAPWLTGLMKVVSCIVVTLYVYVLWRVDRLMATDALALLVTAAGATLVRAAKRDLGVSHTWTGYCVDSPNLVVAGIYAYLRHPLYAGVYVFELGALCTFVPRAGMLPPGLIALAAVCLCYAIVFNAVMATLETRRMSAVFGEAFARYRARVRAFVPLPRP
jgi:protein-S-isoprenylcysteine O-methyltransferase Ste14